MTGLGVSTVRPRLVGVVGVVGVVAVAIGLAGCGGAAHSTPGAAGPDARARWVERVEIVGNRAISDEDLVVGLSTQPPGGAGDGKPMRLDRMQMYVDVDRIEAYYARHGFFQAEVTETTIRPAGSGRVAVRFVVREGAPARVAAVVADGLPPAVARGDAWQKIRDALELGSTYAQTEYVEAKGALRTALHQAGYAHAEVDGTVVVDRPRHEVSIAFQVDAGPRVRFGAIVVKGLEQVDHEAVLARAPFAPGDVFDPDLLDTFRGRLYELGVFAVARVSIERDGRPAVAKVTVQVTEDFGREIRLGGGAAADARNWSVRARAGYVESGFLHPLMTGRIELRPAITWLRANTDAGDPALGGDAVAEVERRDLILRRSRALARLVYRSRDLEGYTRRGPGVRLGYSRSLFSERLSVGVGWELHRLTFSNVSDAIPADVRERVSLVDPYRLGFFDEAVVWDVRDSILAPTRGYYLRARLEHGGAYAGGALDYTRGTAEARGYLRLSDRVVVAARTSYGQGLAGQLPITERFFSGGASQHRGFSARRLSPTAGSTGGDAVPIGGEAAWENSAEVRYDAYQVGGQWIGVVPFVDVADVALSPGEVDPADLHWAVGLGLRYGTPVGPLRLDFARRVTNTGPGQPDPGDRWAFHFSLGEAF